MYKQKSENYYKNNKCTNEWEEFTAFTELTSNNGCWNLGYVPIHSENTDEIYK